MLRPIFGLQNRKCPSFIFLLQENTLNVDANEKHRNPAQPLIDVDQIIQEVWSILRFKQRT